MTDNEIESLRSELRLLRSSVSTDVAQRATKMRSRIADLETELRNSRAELYALITSEHTLNTGLHALDYDAAVSSLISALHAARGSLVDSNVLMTMQVVREMRSKLGLP